MQIDIDKMPRYRSHKTVRALKIERVERAGVDYMIVFEGGELAAVVPTSFFARGQAQAGDYYVVYQDGYASWSPAKVFLEGYSLVEK